MRKWLGVTFGIMTALGGFVDLGQIVFTMQAGALFGYQLLWAIVLGTAAIIVYMEMCGRVAVVAREPVFALVRDRLGKKFGLTVLVVSNLLNLITCAAELGGIAAILHLLTGWPNRLLLTGVCVVFGVVIWFFQFEWIERMFGLSGLVMIVFAVSAVVLRPDWDALAHGLIPWFGGNDAHDRFLYAYFAVGIFSALLMEYEVHFYSSGAIEEVWKPQDLNKNFGVAAFGSLLGAMLTVALLALGALVFLPRGIFPDAISTPAMAGALPFARRALLLALLGILACLSGAAVETALSGAYNVCQFYDLPWGKNQKPAKVRVFTAAWVAMLTLAFILALTGVEPLKLVNMSIIFGMVVMPFTYYPILRVARDHKLMGKHANHVLDDVLGYAFLALIVIAAIAAIPLMLLTHSGKP